jgi:uncharacterized protein
LKNQPKSNFLKITTSLASWVRKLLQGANRPQPKNSVQLPRKAYTLADIDIELLKFTGIRGVILDLDNTIISEDDRFVAPKAEDWIAQAKLAGLKFFILSNGKRRYRVEYWSNRLDIPAISPAKKPFPPAFRKALTHMHLKPKQVIVIGDGLHTDVVGAWLLGCCSIQVATLPHPLRWWEKLAGKWVQTPYPTEGELIDFDSNTSYL